MKRIKQLALLTVGLISTTIATQSFAYFSVPTGWYVDGDYGVSKQSGKSYNTTSNRTSGKGWSSVLGYKINPFFGLEGGYTRYADAILKNSQSITAAHDEHYAIDLAGKFILPITQIPLELYGKAGLSWIHAKIGKVDTNAAAVDNLVFDTSTKTSRGLYAAAGAQYYFTSNFSAHIQYAQAYGSSKTGTLALGSAGLSFLF